MYKHLLTLCYTALKYIPGIPCGFKNYNNLLHPISFYILVNYIAFKPVSALNVASHSLSLSYWHNGSCVFCVFYATVLRTATHCCVNNVFLIICKITNFWKVKSEAAFHNIRSLKIWQFKEHIATGLRVERAGVQIPTGKQIFHLSKTPKKSALGPHPSSYSVGTGFISGG